MGFKCGIVGLPNVGKSTLFNALTQTAAAAAENFPFCTIEPNVGIVPVPDERLDICAQIAGSAKTVPTQLTFVDIAGLVRGASQGEGLGNQFLAHIREVDAIIHLVRCFEDSDITHVEGKVDPIADIDTIETELMLADLESLERQADALTKKARGSDKVAIALLAVAEVLLTVLRDGQPARSAVLDSEATVAARDLQLITAKPILYVCNVDEATAAQGNEFSALVQAHAKAEGAECVVISAAIEAEIAAIEAEEDRGEFLAELGLSETGLTRVIRAGHKLLGLITFLTVGPKEARAWTVEEGATAPQSAGVIHTDFERGFIRAETIAYKDFVEYSGESGARDAGKLRLEGKDYIVHDGDVMHFRFNV